MIENHPSVVTTLVQQNEPISLDYCMEAFTKDEILTGDEKYNCPRCKEFRLATKKLQIFRLPAILVSSTLLILIFLSLPIVFTLNYVLMVSTGM